MLWCKALGHSHQFLCFLSLPTFLWASDQKILHICSSKILRTLNFAEVQVHTAVAVFQKNGKADNNCFSVGHLSNECKSVNWCQQSYFSKTGACFLCKLVTIIKVYKLHFCINVKSRFISMLYQTIKCYLKNKQQLKPQAWSIRPTTQYVFFEHFW